MRNIRTETGAVALQLFPGDKDNLRIDSLEAAEQAFRRAVLSRTLLAARVRFARALVRPGARPVGRHGISGVENRR